MDDKKAAAKTSQIFSAKPNGREKGYMESIYWGVAKPYAYLKDCIKAGVKIDKKRVTPGGAFYYINRADCTKVIKWLNS